MSRLALPLLLALTSACERSTHASEAPGPEAPGADSSESEANRPPGCGSVEDCTNKGTTGVLADDPAAIEMLAYSCLQQSALACQNLSTALRSGRFAEDPQLAHAAADSGCKLQNPGACVDLGVDLSMGLGGAQVDFVAANEHFQMACAAKESKGCRYAGVLQHEGTLPSGPDQVAALSWFEQGCALDDPESCFNVGVLAVEGIGGGQDLDKAQAALGRGCTLGHQDACAALEQITEQLTSKVPDANLRIGEATVDGLTVQNLECRIEGGGLGLLGNMALIGALAQKKKSIDACGKAGVSVEVRWTASAGKITSAQGESKEAACVAKVLKKVASPADGECFGVIVLGG